MFDGSFKTTKRVALGGASSGRGDRASLLEQARKDREERSRKRQETRAVQLVQVRQISDLRLQTRHRAAHFFSTLCIRFAAYQHYILTHPLTLTTPFDLYFQIALQSYWRSSRALSRKRQETRDAWLRLHGDDANKWKKVAANKSEKEFLSRLLFFAEFDRAKDVALMAEVCVLLFQINDVGSCKCPEVLRVDSNQGAQGLSTHRATLNSRRVVVFVMRALSCSSEHDIPVDVATNLVHAVLHVTGSDAWSLPRGGVQSGTENLSKEVVLNLLQTLCEKDHFAKLLREACVRRPTCPAALKLLKVLWPRVVDAKADVNCAFSNTFAAQLGSLPNVYKRGGDPATTWSETCRALSHHFASNSPLAFPNLPHSEDHGDGHEGYVVAWVLANLMEGADLGWAAMSSRGAMSNQSQDSKDGQKFHAVVSFLVAATELLNRLPPGTTVMPRRVGGMHEIYSMELDTLDDNMASDSGDSSSDDEESTRVRKRGTTSSIKTCLPPLAPECSFQIAKLLDSGFLKNVVNACLGGSGSTAQNEQATRTLSDFIGCVLQKLKSGDRNSLLSTLAFGTPFISKTWATYARFCVEKRWPLSSLSHDPGGTVTKYTSTPNSHWISSLGVFAQAYGTFLLTGDDKEFLVSGKPLPVAEIGSVVVTLRDALWYTLWVSDELVDSTDMGYDGHDSHATTTRATQLTYNTKALARALQQVHDRNGRLKLVDPALFHAPELFGASSSVRVGPGSAAAAADGFLAEASADLGYDGVAKRGKKSKQFRSRAAELLLKAPSLVPFDVRVRWFSDGLVRDRMENVGRGGAAEALGMSAEHHVTVRRGSIFSDALQQLGPAVFKQDLMQWRLDNPNERPPGSLKGTIRVRFLNQHGVDEPGVDGGGLFKDFLSALMGEAFDPTIGGLFVETPTRTLYPNPASEQQVGPDHLKRLEFLGAVLGKAVYEQILVDVPLAGFFLSKLRDRRPPELNDLSSLDPELYHHLLGLKTMSASDVEGLGLDFTVTDRSMSDGSTFSTCDLLPNGSNIPVTSQNRSHYVHLMAHHLLHRQIRRQVNAFTQGFRSLIPPETLQVFAPSELGLLISGEGGKINVNDLANSTMYSGGYDDQHESIKLLWSVLAEFEESDQRAFLKFVTACPNTPLLGFQQLVPKFCIHRSGMTGGTNSSEGNADVNRLPTAATCMNMLKLPPYKDRTVFKEKLLLAINSESGFDLS